MLKVLALYEQLQGKGSGLGSPFTWLKWTKDQHSSGLGSDLPSQEVLCSLGF
jgi:hypothetical protein